MALFTISDLHLSLATDKPMDVFHGWNNYVEKLKANWCRTVEDGDTVVIPGDVSWALKTEEVYEDLAFLDSLPGKKILLKGNHDLWWATVKKLNFFLDEWDLKTVSILYNNCIVADKRAICGSRGWSFDSGEQNKKIILREAGRLEMSLKAAVETGLEPTVFLHYPPVCAEYCSEEIMDVLKKYGIKTVYHGHIHGSGLHRTVSEHDGITLKLVSCDCIDFTPYKILP